MKDNKDCARALHNAVRVHNFFWISIRSVEQRSIGSVEQRVGSVEQRSELATWFGQATVGEARERVMESFEVSES